MGTIKNSDSLSSLENVLSSIGEDMKYIYNGVRENWWKLRQVLIVDEIPQGLPSSIFKGETDELSADNDNPILVFSNKNKSLYIWNSNKKVWEPISCVDKSIKEISGDMIILDQSVKNYSKIVNGNTSLKFNISKLPSNSVHEFDLILKVSSGNVEFSEDVIWNKDFRQAFLEGNSYIIKIRVIDGFILLDVCFSSSKI